MKDFASQVAEFAKKANKNIDEQVRGATTALFSAVIQSTPVGNPELWAVNIDAAAYNKQVSEHNKALRNNSDNLDARGHLRRGVRLNDGMDIKKPAGYVGGRARANWNVSVGAPDLSTTDAVDPKGNVTIELAKQNVGGAGTITYMANSLPYIQRLEYGWSKQAPAGMVRTNMARIHQIIAEDRAKRGKS